MDNRELVMLQSLPLDIKIEKSKQRIREAINKFGVDGVYVPVSGGIDSQVVHLLVKEVQEQDGIPLEAIPRVFSNTGNEYDSVVNKARELCDIEIRPSKPLWRVLTEEGYPVGSKKVSRMLRDLQNPTEANYNSRRLYIEGIKRPAMYDLGYRNNNCIGCVKGGMGYWNKIRKDFPEVFEARAKQEREVGHTCLKGIYLDELDPKSGRIEDEVMEDCSIMCQLINTL